MKAGKIQKKVEKVGFDWPSAEAVIPKIREEIDEVDLLKTAHALHFGCCLQIHSDGGFWDSVDGTAAGASAWSMTLWYREKGQELNQHRVVGWRSFAIHAPKSPFHRMMIKFDFDGKDSMYSVPPWAW